MKISSDPGMVSALETWLRDSADPEVIPSGDKAVSAGTPAGGDATAQAAPRDSAECLLELDVWKGMPGGSRQLTCAAVFQPRAADPAAAIQGWTEHIFQPLV